MWKNLEIGSRISAPEAMFLIAEAVGFHFTRG
jgi:hypothetical protein